jgi:hypothetical protein
MRSLAFKPMAAIGLSDFGCKKTVQRLEDYSSQSAQVSRWFNLFGYE